MTFIYSYINIIIPIYINYSWGANYMAKENKDLENKPPNITTQFNMTVANLERIDYQMRMADKYHNEFLKMNIVEEAKMQLYAIQGMYAHVKSLYKIMKPLLVIKREHLGYPKRLQSIWKILFTKDGVNSFLKNPHKTLEELDDIQTDLGEFLQKVGLGFKFMPAEDEEVLKYLKDEYKR